MPQDVDFDFGKKAVAAGLLTQEHLDEAIILLHSLERAGSTKRLSDVVVDRGWIKRPDVQKILAPEAAEASPPGGTSSRDEAGMPFVLAQIRPEDSPVLHKLMHRPMNLGRDKKSDIVIDVEGVEGRHARITHAAHGPVIWDVGTAAGVVVNGVRKTTCDLRAGDLLKMGEALFLVLLDATHEGGETATTLSSTEIIGKLHIEEGLRQGDVITITQRYGVIVGRHRLATVRFEDHQIAEFHAHFAATPAGVRVTDLKSAFGTQVNGKTLGTGLLVSGDVIAIGLARMQYEQIAAVLPVEAEREVEPEEVKKTKDESIFSIPDDVELEVDELESRKAQMLAVGAGLDVARQQTYKLGELVLTAIEGPVEGRTRPIDKSLIVIGRGKEADLYIPDLSVSRKHAGVKLSEEGVLEAEDYGSRNGILVNGRRVARAALHVGDTLRLGTTALVVDRAPKDQSRK
jgi:pSer/pThr/pTyr-binding forkhead associated (FHA) protein